jgi:hypothetical protein
MRIMQVARQGISATGLRLPQAELSRKSKVCRTWIRRFQSYEPSQAIGESGPVPQRSRRSSDA